MTKNGNWFFELQTQAGDILRKKFNRVECVNQFIKDEEHGVAEVFELYDCYSNNGTNFEGQYMIFMWLNSGRMGMSFWKAVSGNDFPIISKEVNSGILSKMKEDLIEKRIQNFKE